MTISFEQALALCRSDPEAAARLIRDIKFLTGLPDAETRAYGQRLLAAVKAMFKVIHRRDETDPAAFQRALEQARDRILSGHHELVLGCKLY